MQLVKQETSRAFTALILAAILGLCVADSSLVQVKTSDGQEENREPVINLAVVSCGDRVPETLTLLKSALMFTKTQLNFYIVTEANLKHLFVQQVPYLDLSSQSC